MMSGSRAMKFLAVAVAVGSIAGCASKKYVQEELETAEQRNAERIELIKAQIEETQMDVEEQGNQIAELSQTSREALDRAVAAGKLAEGKLLYEKVLSDDKLQFSVDKADLSSDAKAELDAFSQELVLRNENVFIEIQGHTDATGSEKYNQDLGEKRAEAVRQYLNAKHAIPLHRMSVISYGESAPLVDNSTRENRARNRRVTLVVLK